MTMFASRGRLVLAALAVLMVLALWSVVSAAAPGPFRSSPDLHAIWLAAQDFWDRQDPYAIFLNYKLHGGSYRGYAPNYIPSFFVLIRPFFVLGWPLAHKAFFAVNVLVTVAAVALLCRLFLPAFSPALVACMACLLLASTPLRTLLEKGQVTMLVLFCFLLAYDFQVKKRYPLAAVFLFFALLKYNVTLPLALVFFRRDAIMPLIVAGLAHAAVVVMAAFWLGESPLLLIENMARVNVYLLYDGHVNYSNILGTFGAEGARAGLLVSAAISLLAVLLMVFRRPADDLLALGLLSLVSLLVVYHGSYDMVMLLIPMAYVVQQVTNGSALALPRTQQAGMIAIALSTALLWYVLEFADAVGSRTLGNHSFVNPHVVFLWYTLMIALTLSLAMLFVTAFNRQTKDDLLPSVSYSA